MKTLFKTILPAFAAGALAFMAESCGNTGANQSIDFTTRADSTAVMLPDYLGDTAYIATRYSVVWPEKIGQQDFDAFKDSLVNLTFGTTGVNTFDQGVAAFKKQPVTEMGADSMKTEPADYAIAAESAYATINMAESNVSLLTPDLLVIDVNHYGYITRAAHGMSTLNFLNYSIKEHTLLTPDNFFTPDAAKSISPMIKKIAREKYSEEALFADATYSINNFRITEDNVEFVYQPYEVGPYSSGIITVALSHYDLKPYLSKIAVSTLGL